MKKSAFRLTALSVALTGTAQAQEDPAVTALTKPQSEVSAGVGYWSKDRPRLGTYDGQNQKGAYGLLDAFINRRDDATGTWFGVEGRNLGQEAMDLRLDYLRQGNFGAFLLYERTPRDEPYTVRTGVLGIGTNVQRVPSPSATALGDIHLGTVRDAWTGGLAKNFGDGYDFRVSFKNEDKKGDRLWGRGGAAEFAAEPIDHNMKQLEAVLSRTGEKFQVQGGYFGSWFTNAYSGVDTALTTGASPFFLTLPLDNQAHQVFVNGGYNISERTRATFKAAYTRATQDEQIPVGPGVTPAPTAPTHLSGRLDTTLLQAGVSQRTTSTFSWLASLRNYESDEKTPVHRVVGPACPGCVDTTPLTVKTLSGKLEGTYRFAQGISVTGGYDYSNQDRNVPVGDFSPAGFDNQRYVPWRTEVEEQTFRIEARRALSETLNGRIALAHSKRDGSEYTLTNEPQSDLINPVHIADRDRNKLKLMVDWTPVQPLTLIFNVDYAQDDYKVSDARPYALIDGTAATYSLDAAYAINENWTVNAWYTRDQTEAKQRGQRNASSGAAEAVKEANLEDIGDTFGLGLRATVTPKVKAGVDVLYQRNVNKYPESVTPIGAGTVYPISGAVSAVGPLPDITNKLMRFNLHALYALDKNASLRFDYIYEQWKTDDWSWMFAGGAPFTYGTTTDGTQVVQASKQNANWLSVRYIYRFQ
jgi:MtrB/PioB family decaheme-associated outer membrane protein